MLIKGDKHAARKLALAVDTHEEWVDGARYLNMELLREHKKQQLKAA